MNRLRKGMRLQTDPTVIYAVTDGSMELNRRLTHKDLKTPHPFNTYVNRGLPPAPICNPGRDSILAVLQPLKTNELYFVADGTGGHVFSQTFDQHRRNIAAWKKARVQKRLARRKARLAALKAKERAATKNNKKTAVPPPAPVVAEEPDEPMEPEDVSLDIIDSIPVEQPKQ